MSTSSSDPSRPRWTAPLDLVVVSGAGEPGLRSALMMLHELPDLRCPTLFSLRDADPAPLHDFVDGKDVRFAGHRDELCDARVWVAPSDRNAVVRAGRFELGEPGVASIGQLPSLGMLYHSVRVEFGSRVFVVVADQQRCDTPLLRLLAQRGANVVTPLEGAAFDGPLHLTIPEIVVHLGERAGAAAEAAAA